MFPPGPTMRADELHEKRAYFSLLITFLASHFGEWYGRQPRQRGGGIPSKACTRCGLVTVGVHERRNGQIRPSRTGSSIHHLWQHLLYLTDQDIYSQFPKRAAQPPDLEGLIILFRESSWTDRREMPLTPSKLTSPTLSRLLQRRRAGSKSMKLTRPWQSYKRRSSYHSPGPTWVGGVGIGLDTGSGNTQIL